MMMRNTGMARTYTASIAALIFLLFPVLGKAQVSPIQGLGSIQLLDNTGALATSGCFYFFQAGTSTQQATFTDSSGLTQNTNPLCLGSGARATGVWLTTSQFYKIVACLANDGPTCNASDVLWSQDNVPGGASSSGGGGSAPFITNSASPATSGILRLASGDTVCWRNQAGSANLCLSKDANDLFSIPTAWKLPEISTPSCTVGFEVLWADNTAHALKECANGGGPIQLVGGGPGLNISAGGNVVGFTFGSTPTPLSGTAPTTGQYLQWNGTSIIGVSTSPGPEMWFGDGNSSSQTTTVSSTGRGQIFFANAHTLVRLFVTVPTQGSGCSTLPVISVRDMTASSNLASVTISNGVGTVDSGVLSVAMTAGHTFIVYPSTASSGCTTSPIVSANATYQ